VGESTKQRGPKESDPINQRVTAQGTPEHRRLPEETGAITPDHHEVQNHQVADDGKNFLGRNILRAQGENMHSEREVNKHQKKK